MRALILNKAEGHRSASLAVTETPAPGPGEVRVRLKSSALNHRELWICIGQYPGIQLPAILGADGSGLVDALGEGTDDSLLGKRVVLYPAANWGDNTDYPAPEFGCLGMPYAGTLAEFICVPADSIVEIPEGYSFEEAAAIPLAGLTAWRSLTIKARVKPGEKVLITGIGGGVASSALSIAVALGAEVYVTSGSRENIDMAVALGARGGVNYNEEKWGKTLAKQCQGVDVVIDGAPAVSFGQYSPNLRMGARVVVYGPTGGATFQVVAPELFFRHASIFGSAMGTLQDFKDMFAFITEKQLKPVIDRVFTLEQSVEALTYLKEEHRMGKVIVNI